jgi:MbtH protein
MSPSFRRFLPEKVIAVLLRTKGSTHAMSEQDAQTQYLVVINDEEQYSIWAADREVPGGWQATGVSGTRDECLAHIGEVWTDMRPRSLRLAIAASD